MQMRGRLHVTEGGVLTVPRLPAMAMPPRPVSTAPSKSACLISSCPMTAVRGSERVSLRGKGRGRGRVRMSGQRVRQIPEGHGRQSTHAWAGRAGRKGQGITRCHL